MNQELMIKKLVNIKNKVDTWENHIKSGIFSKVEIGTKPLIQYNRIKFNRMDNNKEQDIYMEKCNETKPDYRLYFKGNNVFISVSKLIYLYAYKEISK